MPSSRRRAPLSDLSNVSPQAPLTSSASQGSRPSKAIRVLALDEAPPHHSKLSIDAEGQTAAPPLPSPNSSPPKLPISVEANQSTPRGPDTENLEPSLLREESVIRHCRLKEASSGLIRSCPPPRNHSRNVSDDTDTSNAFKRELPRARLEQKLRRHSLPSFPVKPWLPEDYVAAQRLHFAEVDAFQLSEEEGDLSDEAEANDVLVSHSSTGGMPPVSL